MALVNEGVIRRGNRPWHPQQPTVPEISDPTEASFPSPNIFQDELDQSLSGTLTQVVERGARTARRVSDELEEIQKILEYYKKRMKAAEKKVQALEKKVARSGGFLANLCRSIPVVGQIYSAIEAGSEAIKIVNDAFQGEGSVISKTGNAVKSLASNVGESISSLWPF